MHGTRWKAKLDRNARPTPEERCYFRGMKPLILLPAVSLALLMFSCGDGKADAVKRMAEVADSLKAANTIDLAEHHLPLVVHVPVGMPPASVVWKDEAGKLSVKAGDHFALEIHEAPADMQRLKDDLDRDLLQKNTILEETPDLLIYRSEFPDDSTLVFFHFHQFVNTAGRSFIIDDEDNGDAFTREDVQRMAKSVQAKEPA